MRLGSRKVALLFVAFALVLAACSSGDDSSGSGSGGDGEAAAGGTETVAVTLTDFKIQPNDIQVPSGTELSFEITNEGPSPHTFAVKVGSESYDTGNIEAGASATIAVPALEAGQYDTLCTVPGHDELGMVGTLTATAEGAAGATGAAGASGAAGEMTGMTAEEMAQGHEQGVLDFLAGKETDTYGLEPLEPEMDGKVKVFNLTVDEIKWEISKGNFIDGMAFNGQIPGPEIRVHKGDRVRFVVQNQLEEPFALHFHGVTVPNEMDGVPYVTQPAIMPGEYWTYEYTIVDDPGMMIYHSHFNSAEQESAGLYGPLLIEPKQGGWKNEYGVKPDVEYTMFLGDGTLGYNLNAKSFPATQPIVSKKGDKVLFHLVNNGALLHPMHLHGFHFEVVAEDGFVLDPEDRYMADTIVVAPGQRFDIMVDADYPGAWAFHCHILPHAEGPAGMFGMVTALVVQ